LGHQAGPSHSSAERLIDKENEAAAAATGTPGGNTDFNLYSDMLPPDLARQLMMGIVFNFSSSLYINGIF